MDKPPLFNVEIKAKIEEHDLIRSILKQHGANSPGTDRQIDTYYKVKNGRLKLREGNIENALIYYQRPNASGPRKSDVLLYKTNPRSDLKQILSALFETLVVVKKEREIWFIENVKFHLDRVDGLGQFVEIEAIRSEAYSTEEKLTEQCNFFSRLLKIGDKDLISRSYSDMLLESV
jgi:predicted adenylyl cyclase CyaB